MKFIDDYKDLPLVIKISNGLGKKLGEYLLNNDNNKGLSRLFYNGYNWLIFSN